MKKPHYPFPISVVIAGLLFLLLFIAPSARGAETPPPSPTASAAKKAQAEGKKPAAKPVANVVNEAPRPGDIYLRQVSLDEAAQLIARIGRTSIVVTGSVANKVVSLYLRDVPIEGMVKNLCRAAGVWYRFDARTNTYLIMSAQEYQQDIAITRDDMTRIHVLKHHNVVSVANAIQALFGSRVELVEPVEEMPPELGGGSSRTDASSYGSSSYGSSSYGSSTYSASSNRRASSYNGLTRRSSGGRGRQQNDSRRELNTVSQAGLDAVLTRLETTLNTSVASASAPDSSRAANLTTSEVMRASQQGAPINLTYNLLHNLILARSSDEAALKDIEALILEMDRPPRQVLLEMKIMEVELGNDFQSIFDIGLSSKGTSAGPMELGIGAGAIGALANGDYPSNATSFGNFSQESSTFAWQFVSDRLRARLQLLESANRVNVLATPMIVAANNQIARLFIGDERTLVTGASIDTVTGNNFYTTSFVTVETEQRNVGQTLIILPRINADRSVTLTIDQDNSRILPGSTMLPLAVPGVGLSQYPIDTVNTANLQVTAHAQDGLTVAVGGMISQTISSGEEKTPLLGDVPILGALFKKTTRENRRSQIVLLITPWVLETPQESHALARRKEDETKELGTSKAPHKTIFERAPADQRPRPLLDLLNPAGSAP
jgi:general secretion pathway protein D